MSVYQTLPVLLFKTQYLHRLSIFSINCTENGECVWTRCMKICFSFRCNSYGPWTPTKCDSMPKYLRFGWQKTNTTWTVGSYKGYVSELRQKRAEWEIKFCIFWIFSHPVRFALSPYVTSTCATFVFILLLSPSSLIKSIQNTFTNPFAGRWRWKVSISHIKRRKNSYLFWMCVFWIFYDKDKYAYTFGKSSSALIYRYASCCNVFIFQYNYNILKSLKW